MKTCNNCGKQIDEQASFCIYCGQEVVEEVTENKNEPNQTDNYSLVTCPSCNDEISEESNFCPSCGKKIAKGESGLKKLLKNKKFIIPIVGSLIVLVAVILSLNYLQTKKEERRLLEIKQEEIKRQEEAAARAREAAAKERKDFQEAIDILNSYDYVSDIIDFYSNIHGKPYVSVGWAASFPDRVLISIVWAQQKAYQALISFNEEENPRGSAFLYRDFGELKEVSPYGLSDKIGSNWNATVDEVGKIYLKDGGLDYSQEEDNASYDDNYESESEGDY